MITWKCSVCLSIRPDRCISVVQVPVKAKGTNSRVIQNIKYCNDRPFCINNAKTINLFGTEEWELCDVD